jgi:hypothetical protein
MEPHAHARGILRRRISSDLQDKLWIIRQMSTLVKLGFKDSRIQGFE